MPAELVEAGGERRRRRGEAADVRVRQRLLRAAGEEVAGTVLLDLCSPVDLPEPGGADRRVGAQRRRQAIGLAARPALQRSTADELRRLARIGDLRDDAARIGALGDQAAPDTGVDLVDERRAHRRTARLVDRRIGQHELVLGHGEREEEQERLLEAALAGCPQEAAEREPGDVRAERRAQAARRQRVQLPLEGVRAERALAARRRERAVVQPEHVDRVEVEAARVEHPERADAAGALAAVLDLQRLQRGDERAGEGVQVDRAQPHGLGEPGEAVERLLEPGRREGIPPCRDWRQVVRDDGLES